MRTAARLPVLLLAALLSARPLAAQRLLWEHAVTYGLSSTQTVFSTFLTADHKINVSYSYYPPRTGTGCQPFYTYFRTYDLTGNMLRERRGRNAATSDGCFEPAPAAGSGSWWASNGSVCSALGTQYARPYLQRLSARGDTVRGFWLAPAPPGAYAVAALAASNRLVTAGFVEPAGQPRHYQLTCTDTSGTVRWQYTYPRPGTTGNSQCSALVRTPRGGYLLSGDGQSGIRAQHYLLETDSLGQQLKQRLLDPLGPNFASGKRYSVSSNVLVLPNAQGYLLSGTADSAMTSKLIGYVMRLDTALNVQWVYRNPPRTNGNTNRSQYAYKIRMLSPTTVGLMLVDVRSNGTPDVYLVAVDIATGQRRGVYTLSSNTQSAVIPYDWQWVGDGTLLIAGKSAQFGVTGQQGYLARWDFRGTPLATRPALVTAAGSHQLQAYPTPSRDQVTIEWAPTPGTAPARLEVRDVATGRLVRSQAVADATAVRLSVAELAPGLYVSRLVDAAGQVLGTGKVVVMR